MPLKPTRRRILAATILLTAVIGGGWYLAQRQTSGTSASTPGVSETGAPLVNVTVPATLSARAKTGETYFNAACASCHGQVAAGQDGIAPPLVHRIYEPSHHGDAAFVRAARQGVRAHHWPFGDMPPIEQKLSDAELSAIIAYVRELQRANGIN